MRQENQCQMCGRFMRYDEWSTEAGYDFEFVCTNSRCKVMHIDSFSMGHTNSVFPQNINDIYKNE